MTMTSTDRVLVTGVDTRLGAAVRDHFAGRGAVTVGTVTADRDPGPAAELTLTADPTDRAAVGHAVAKAAAHMGGIDVLVVAHGLPVVAPLADQPMMEFWAHVDSNLTGSFLYAQAAAEHMRHSGTGGRIVLTTSRWHVGGDGLAAVATAAGGIVALTKSLTRDFGGFGVGVNAVALGGLDSEWSVCDGSGGEPPGGRAGSVEQAAAVIGLLSQRQLGAAVGQIVNVDGGMSRNRV
jgi:NAD(P)-dependent dehydrogenase (short-subunit alcohol dehydrogenase family)